MKLLLATLALAGSLWADWITPNGKAYHPRRSCISLTRSKAVAEISKAEAEKRGLKVCGICSRWKTEKAEKK